MKFNFFLVKLLGLCDFEVFKDILLIFLVVFIGLFIFVISFGRLIFSRMKFFNIFFCSFLV